MRYIPKHQHSKAQVLLNKARVSMRQAGISETYDHFHEKKQLNDILRKEQKHICCYCQRRILQGKDNEGSHNEHFEPEGGSHARVDLQLEYHNLYACCNASKGFEKRLQHCGEHKGDAGINHNFLRMHDCADYFKYNTAGEILPQCAMNTYEEVRQNQNRLSDMQRNALQAIEILNLNVESLKAFRKKVQADVFKSVLGKSSHQLERKIQQLNTAQDEYIPLVDMVIYFLKIIAKKHQG